jgi:hypothetical protein
MEPVDRAVSDFRQYLLRRHRGPVVAAGHLRQRPHPAGWRPDPVRRDHRSEHPVTRLPHRGCAVHPRVARTLRPCGRHRRTAARQRRHRGDECAGHRGARQRRPAAGRPAVRPGCGCECVPAASHGSFHQRRLQCHGGAPVGHSTPDARPHPGRHVVELAQLRRRPVPGGRVRGQPDAGVSGRVPVHRRRRSARHHADLQSDDRQSRAPALRHRHLDASRCHRPERQTAAQGCRWCR